MASPTQPTPPDLPRFDVNVNQIDWFRFFQIFWGSIAQNRNLLNFVFQEATEIVTPAFVTVAFEVSLRVFSELGRRLGELVSEFESTTHPVILQAAAEGLSDFFQTRVSAGDLRRDGSQARARRLADRLGRLVMSQMFREFDRPGPPSPQLGRQNAEKFVGFALSTAIEGWLTGAISSSPLSWLFPNWADLDDIVSRNLGIGRLTRRIMNPLLQALVVEPFRWDLNRRLTPEMFSEVQAVRALHRGQISEDEYFETLARHGWDRRRAATLKVVNARMPEKEDIQRFLELGQIDEGEVEGLFAQLGFIPEVSKLMARTLIDDRVRTINTALESVARDMFRDREIDQNELDRLLRVAQRSKAERELLIGLAKIERARPRRLTSAQMERAFRADYVTVDELRGFYIQEGYAPSDVVVLMQLALRRKFEEQEKEAQRRAANQPNLTKNVS